MSKSKIWARVESWKRRQVLPSSRSLTQWTFAGLRIVLLVASLFLVTWVVNYNPVSWDLSEEHLFSISAQTRSVLQTLEAPVTLTAFLPSDNDPAIERLLLAYADESPLVDFRIVDPEAEPALAFELNVRDYGLIVEGTERVQRATAIEEPEITNAILAVTQGEPVPICFLVGHGERDWQDKERSGLSAAGAALGQTNYAPAPVNLGTSDAVPDRCRVVVLAAPKADILPSELDSLVDFLDADGRLMVMLETQVETPVLNELLGRYGLHANNDFVIDTRRNGQQFGLGLQAPVVDEYTPHPITEGFRVMTMFNLPRSVTPTESMPDGLDVRALARSTPSSWGETEFDRSQGATWDPEVDLAGPLPIVVAVGRAVQETPRAYRERLKQGEPAPVGDAILVVAGDVDFASNSLFGFRGNGDLFLNSVSWLAGQQELISIRPKAVANKRILLTDSRKALSFALLVILLPMVPAMTGVVIMVKRIK